MNRSCSAIRSNRCLQCLHDWLKVAPQIKVYDACLVPSDCLGHAVDRFMSSGETTPPCGTLHRPLAFSMIFSRCITSLSLTRFATLANNRSCRTLSKEDTTDYPPPGSPKISGDYAQAAPI